MQEHLAVFVQLVGFHDPELAAHLADMGFMPELFAIPWFLTLFAHVFPIASVCTLWDTLLLGPPSLPLFMAVALMYQVRGIGRVHF